MSVSSNDDGSFEETNEQQIFSKYFKIIFTINYVLNFFYVIFNEKSFNKKFLLTGNI